MEQVKFIVPGEPCGKGRPRFSRKLGKAYTPDKTAMYENLVKVEYQSQCKAYKFPDGAMLDMRILAYYGIPKSESKKKKALMRRNAIRPTKRPDFDNVAKLVADALNQVAYRDDTQIVDCQVRKFYSDEPRTEVLIMRTGGN